jgi:hypothetical protein
MGYLNGSTIEMRPDRPSILYSQKQMKKMNPPMADWNVAALPAPYNTLKIFTTIYCEFY